MTLKIYSNGKNHRVMSGGKGTYKERGFYA